MQTPAEPTPQHFQLTIETGGQTAIEALHQATGLSKAALKEGFSKGAVWLQQGEQKPLRLRRVKKTLSPGDRLDCYYDPKLLAQTPQAPALILDRGAYSVWHKPRGMRSQGSKWSDHAALYRWVEMHYRPEDSPQGRQAWIVHRLDRATAGLQILAHSKRMAQTFTRLFSERQIHKRYLAIVHRCPAASPATLTTPIDDKPAVSHLRTLDCAGEIPLALVEIDIETGRKHQIRKHLAEIGCPLVGDRLYGDATLDQNLQTRLALTERPDLQLTAYRLNFDCPLSHAPVNLELPHTDWAMHATLLACFNAEKLDAARLSLSA
ncbi:RluA family pseudouridine synthase [Thiomicrorhabdus cannonii]|uniref:RluA family pseudouridine synthase n=1 Tax=Thiomicrorhabdus cannonii TaxID=2748011 RepID=UPI0015BCBCAF|nr:RNA pseudouridine synthase [Thiomicrorhabdus cannonii]